MNRRFFTAVVVITAIYLAGCRSGMDLSRSDTQLNVGVRAARSNLWREALFRFNRAVQIEPSNAMALNNLAVAYEGTGEFEKARQAYTEALRLDKSNQFIQKNYSRFVEFYSRNKKRELQIPAGGPVPSSAPATTRPAPVSPPPPAQPITQGGI